MSKEKLIRTKAEEIVKEEVRRRNCLSTTGDLQRMREVALFFASKFLRSEASRSKLEKIIQRQRDESSQ